MNFRVKIFGPCRKLLDKIVCYGHRSGLGSPEISKPRSKEKHMVLIRARETLVESGDALAKEEWGLA